MKLQDINLLINNNQVTYKEKLLKSDVFYDRVKMEVSYEYTTNTLYNYRAYY